MHCRWRFGNAALLCCELLRLVGATSPQSKIPSAVLELNDKFLDVRHEGVWFVKFYAPWCGHCKSLAPVWEQLGHELDNRNAPIRVAKIDCTRFTNVAADLAIRGYPTLKFFRNGQEIEYEGERTKDALVDFAMKSLGPDVRNLHSVAALGTALAENKDDVLFILVTGNGDGDAPADEAAAGQSRTALPDWFASVASQLFTKSKFYKIDNSALPRDHDIVAAAGGSLPAVFAVRDEQYVPYEQNGDVSEMHLYNWVQSERWPTFPQLGYGNLREAGTCCGKMLVLATMDYVARTKARSDSHRFNRLVSTVADSVRRKGNQLRDKYIFGWLDGNYIASNIALGEQPIPSLLVLNYTSYEFYVPEDQVNYMTEQSLELFLKGVAGGTRRPLGGRGPMQRVKRMAYEFFTAIYNMFATQPLLTCCLFGLPSGILAIICYSLCSADFSVDHDEVYPDSETEHTDEGEEHEKYD